MFIRKITLSKFSSRLLRHRSLSTKKKEASDSLHEIPLLSPFQYHRCPDSIKDHILISKEELLTMYYQMNVIRRMELAADNLYKSKYIRGFCHLSIGQEAIPVGTELAITKQDLVITAYRCHGFAYIRGGSIISILEELMGRRNGIAKGKGGSMHMFAPEFYGGNGIVGAQIPVGLGIGLAHQYRNQDRVCFAFYGDGASNQGQAFEAYNMGQLWKVPVVFVCENNQYSMGTSLERGCASTELYKRGDFVPGIRVNGMDVLAVKKACEFAKQYALKQGPILLEMMTYRYQGHSMSDPGTTYRTRDEIQKIRQTQDPIQGFKLRLLEDLKICDEHELQELDQKAKDSVNEAVELAKQSPEPDMSEMYKDIYAPHSEPSSIRGCAPDEIYKF